MIAGQNVVVADRTLPLCGTSKPCIGDRDVLRELRLAAGDDYETFAARNRASIPIPPLGGSVLMASPEAVNEIMDRSGWDEFYCVYPAARGVIYFSAPAYSGNRAIVYYEVGCDLLCGSGWVARLARDKGSWKIVSQRSLWSS